MEVASVASAAGLACLAGAAVLDVAVGGERFAGMARGRLVARLDLGLQACRHAHRTPALEPEIKPRTNRALSRRGGDGSACRVVQYEIEMEMHSNFSGRHRCFPSRY